MLLSGTSLLPGEETLLGYGREIIMLQSGTLFFDLLLERQLVLCGGLVSCHLVGITFLLGHEHVALREHVPVNTTSAAVGTLPTPTVLLVLDGIHEVLASNNRVLRHLVGAHTRILVEVHLLVVFNLLVLGVLQVLRVFENGCQQSLLLSGLSLFLLLLVLLLLSSSGTALFIAVHDLTLHLLHVPIHVLAMDYLLLHLGRLVFIFQPESFVFNDLLLHFLLGLLTHLVAAFTLSHFVL